MILIINLLGVCCAKKKKAVMIPHVFFYGSYRDSVLPDHG